VVVTDERLIDFLEEECCDLRCVSISNGDDADIGWEVIQHHMGKPKERRIGYGSSPREAILRAMKEIDNQCRESQRAFNAEPSRDNNSN
jgi:hypothetical protein